MKDLIIEDGAAAAASRCAELLAELARQAIEARGMFTVAVSGGRTPWTMLEQYATADIPWERVQLFQVDERIAPDGDPARNLTGLQRSFVEPSGIPAANVHPMPVTATDLASAAADYASELVEVCGEPPLLDVAHLGLGDDGHTASLVPGDPVLAIRDRTVALTGPYQGHRRMTLTLPTLNHARHVLFLGVGEAKSALIDRLLSGDTTIPAGLIDQTRALLVTDRAGAGRA
ncbi:MAG: 6-phosphogluconolactonase [Acidimicrobiales bacterium]|nr:6-phosphogluconolactonase [Acidimicrobiales bacterium]RIK06232.1 MAG: 6-phosphogluconolactonase [Acidobacteriota bacterium]